MTAADTDLAALGYPAATVRVIEQMGASPDAPLGQS